MKPARVLAVLLAACGLCSSQDLKLREEAVRLLERANAISSSPHLPARELVHQRTFTPAMCDGHPDAHEVDFMLHFQGR